LSEVEQWLKNRFRIIGNLPCTFEIHKPTKNPTFLSDLLRSKSIRNEADEVFNWLIKDWSVFESTELVKLWTISLKDFYGISRNKQYLFISVKSKLKSTKRIFINRNRETL